MRRSSRSTGELMNNAVIPAPGRIDHKGGEFTLRSGATIAYIDIELAPIVERFCSEVTRRMGLRVLPITGNPGSNAPSIRVELATADELGVLLAPSGVSPMGDRPCDERHSLVIDEHRVVVRAAEPVGVARGLSTLIQMLATTPSNSASEVSVPTGQRCSARNFRISAHWRLTPILAPGSCDCASALIAWATASSSRICIASSRASTPFLTSTR